VSDGKDLPDNSNGEDDCGDDDNDGDNNDWAINLPATIGTVKLQYHAANNAAGGGGDNDDNDFEGVPRKTLVTVTIWRKTDATDTDILEGGTSNGPTTKVRQYSSLTFEASALPRSGCS
jgi:hypothetical protein